MVYSNKKNEIELTKAIQEKEEVLEILTKRHENILALKRKTYTQNLLYAFHWLFTVSDIEEIQLIYCQTDEDDDDEYFVIYVKPPNKNPQDIDEFYWGKKTNPDSDNDIWDNDIWDILLYNEYLIEELDKQEFPLKDEGATIFLRRQSNTICDFSMTLY